MLFLAQDEALTEMYAQQRVAAVQEALNSKDCSTGTVTAADISPCNTHMQLAHKIQMAAISFGVVSSHSGKAFTTLAFR